MLSIMKKDDGYYLNIAGNKSALIYLGEHGPIVMGALEEQYNTIELQMISVPCGNFYKADRYDTDDEMVIHLWNEKSGNSFDIRVSKYDSKI